MEELNLKRLQTCARNSKDFTSKAFPAPSYRLDINFALLLNQSATPPSRGRPISHAWKFLINMRFVFKGPRLPNLRLRSIVREVNGI